MSQELKDALTKTLVGLAATTMLGLGGAGLDANMRLRDVQHTAEANAAKIQATQEQSTEALRERAFLDKRMSLVEQQIGFVAQGVAQIQSDQRELLRRTAEPK